jgi:hypothetical protein
MIALAQKQQTTLFMRPNFDICGSDAAQKQPFLAILGKECLQIDFQI